MPRLAAPRQLDILLVRTLILVRVREPSVALFDFGPVHFRPPIAHVLFPAPHAIILQVAMFMYAQAQQRVQRLSSELVWILKRDRRVDRRVE